MSQSAMLPRAARPHRQPPLNTLLVWLLQSPLHPLASGSHLVVRYRGRKSGIERTFPVGYVTLGDEIVILVGRAETKSWWRNFIAPWPISLVLRGRTFSGTGLVVKGETDEGVRLAAAFFDRHQGLARARGLRLMGGQAPDLDAICAAASGLTFVRVSACEEISR